MHRGLPWSKDKLVNTLTWARSAWTSGSGSAWPNVNERIWDKSNDAMHEVWKCKVMQNSSTQGINMQKSHFTNYPKLFYLLTI
jgi:hypothetical protein